jgi:hypothetical protein
VNIRWTTGGRETRPAVEISGRVLERRWSVLLLLTLDDLHLGMARLIRECVDSGQPSCRRLIQLAVTIISRLCSPGTGTVIRSSAGGVIERKMRSFLATSKDLVGGLRPLDEDKVQYV